ELCGIGSRPRIRGVWRSETRADRAGLSVPAKLWRRASYHSATGLPTLSWWHRSTSEARGTSIEAEWRRDSGTFDQAVVLVGRQHRLAVHVLHHDLELIGEEQRLRALPGQRFDALLE